MISCTESTLEIGCDVVSSIEDAADIVDDVDSDLIDSILLAPVIFSFLLCLSYIHIF